MSSASDPPTLTKVIRHAIREARLAYAFAPNSYIASAFSAALGVERKADHLDHHDTTTNRERIP
jgi:hypothetical protein